jgi:hypothetical protein
MISLTLQLYNINTIILEQQVHIAPSNVPQCLSCIASYNLQLRYLLVVKTFGQGISIIPCGGYNGCYGIL